MKHRMGSIERKNKGVNTEKEIDTGKDIGTDIETGTETERGKGMRTETEGETEDEINRVLLQVCERLADTRYDDRLFQTVTEILVSRAVLVMDCRVCAEALPIVSVSTTTFRTTLRTDAIWRRESPAYAVPKK